MTSNGGVPADKGAPNDLLLTIISADHIPVGDPHGRSDAYIIAKVKNIRGLLHSTPTQSPASRVHFRTSTVQRTRNPTWNEAWQVGGVRKGTYVKLKLYDQDPRKRLDDKLGSIKYFLDDLVKLEGDGVTLDLPMREDKGAKHVQLLTACYDVCNLGSKADKSLSTVKLKIQILQTTHPDVANIHIISPTRWSVHQSPLVNLITSAPQHNTTPSAASEPNPELPVDHKNRFKAYRINLIHPPPPQSILSFSANADHAKSFDTSKVKYRMAYKMIRKQYRNIYGYDANTKYGCWWKAEEVGLGLVRLLQPDVESKLFTFVVTLHGEWRFCETGDEYKINHLSKHSMHSDGQAQVAWGGEFFIRNTASAEGYEEEQPLDGAVREVEETERSHAWTIFLDNDSGTYSPEEGKIGVFREFMARNLVGINVVVKNFKDEELKEAKQQQKEEV